MVEEKRGLKSVIQTYFLILNLVVAIFAFSYLVSAETVGRAEMSDFDPNSKTPIPAGNIKPIASTTTGAMSYKINSPFEFTDLKTGKTIKVTDISSVSIKPSTEGAIITQGDKSFSIANTELSSAIDNGVVSEVYPKGSSMLSQFFGAAGGGGWDALLTGLEYAGLGWGAGQLIGGIAGMDDEQKNALSAGLAAGAFTAKSLLTLKYVNIK